MMHSIHPTFWLVGLAAFAIPIGVTAGCHQQSTQVSTSDTSNVTTFHATTKPVGITITGVN